MKLFIPPVEIAPDEGFTTQNDIFKREPFGRGLAELVGHSEEGLVIALDAPWGEGKTTFIKQWRGLLSSKTYGVESIYFDAFAGDYYDDPLAALASELYEYIEAKENLSETPSAWTARKNDFLNGAKKWGKAALVTGLRVGVKAASAGIVSLDDIQDGLSETQKDVVATAAKELTKSSEDFIVKKLEHYFSTQKELKQGVLDIREALTKISQDIKGESGKPLVFIIDELDRCRPDFALDLLERVKHIFSVPGIVYVLVCNSTQLEEHVKTRYGINAQAQSYLAKFIDISLRLPKKEMLQSSSASEDDTAKYVQYLIDRLDMPKGRLHRDTLSALSALSSSLNLSFRDIEKVFSYMALYHNSTPDNRLNLFNIILGLCVIKVKNHMLFNTVSSGKPCWDAVYSFFKFEELLNVKSIATTIEWFMEEWRLCTELDKPISEKGKELLNSLHRYSIYERSSIITSMAVPFKFFLQTE